MSVIEAKPNWEAKAILLIEAYYRVVQGIALLLYANYYEGVFTQRAYAIWIAALYLVCALGNRAWWLASRSYARQEYRAIRYGIECLLVLLFVLVDGGAVSFGFAMLLMPVFFASYRFHGRFSFGLLLGTLAGYVLACVMASRIFAAPLPLDRVLTALFIVGLAWYLSRHVRLFLVARLERFAKAAKNTLLGKEGHVQMDRVAFVLAQTLAAQACLVFRREGEEGDYQLTASSVKGRCPDMSLTVAAKGVERLAQRQDARKDATAWRLSRRDSLVYLGEPFVCGLEEQFLRDTAAPDASEPAGATAKHFESGIITLVGAPDGTKLCILLINCHAEPLCSKWFGADQVQYFREEDEILLYMCAAATLMREWWHAIADSWQAALTTGIADEVAVLDRAGKILEINAVKLNFFRLKPEQAIGQRCYTRFHGYKSRNEGLPCSQCQTLNVTEGEPARWWKTPFVHPATRRRHVLKIHAALTKDSLGHDRIIETASDVTMEEQHETLRVFLTDIQTRAVDEDPVQERRIIVHRMLRLFQDLCWIRARLYWWDVNTNTFTCLGAVPEPGGVPFELKVPASPEANEGDWASAQWVHRVPVDPRPKLYTLKARQNDRDFIAYLEGMETQYRSSLPGRALAGPDGDAGRASVSQLPYEVNYVHSFPPTGPVDTEQVTVKLDIPLIVGGKLVGKITLDTFDEATKKEAMFGLRDILLAQECSGLLGHILMVWRQRQAFERHSSMVMSTAHQILAPIGTVGLCLQRIADAGATEENLWAANTAVARATHMADVQINAARIGQGLIEANITDVDLAALVAETERMYRPVSEHKKVRLNVKCPPQLMVRTDGLMASIVLDNLVSNAIEYCDAGAHVTLVLEESGNQARLIVEDSGPGLPAEIAAKFTQHKLSVFQPNRGGHEKGLGIGLAVVETYVRQLGWTPNLVVRPGQGTRFEFVISVTDGQTQEQWRSDAAESGAGRKRVLILDDDIQYRTILEARFREEGCEVDVAQTADECLRLARRKPDLIVFDLLLGGDALAGVVVAKELAHNAETASIPRLCLTVLVKYVRGKYPEVLPDEMLFGKPSLAPLMDKARAVLGLMEEHGGQPHGTR